MKFKPETKYFLINLLTPIFFVLLISFLGTIAVNYDEAPFFKNFADGLAVVSFITVVIYAWKNAERMNN